MIFGVKFSKEGGNFAPCLVLCVKPIPKCRRSVFPTTALWGIGKLAEEVRSGEKNVVSVFLCDSIIGLTLVELCKKCVYLRIRRNARTTAQISNRQQMRPILLIILTLGLFACNTQTDNAKVLQHRIDRLERQLADTYKPGFGEFMSSIQAHHSKLWFAGQNENWKLADFEVHEIMESIADIQKLKLL